MATKSIAIDYNDSIDKLVELDFPAKFTEENDDTKTFKVKIDGKDSPVGFRYEVEQEDWFDVFVEENSFAVIVKENFNLTERYANIVFHHNSMQDKLVKIVEEGEEYYNNEATATVLIKQEMPVCVLTAVEGEVSGEVSNEVGSEENTPNSIVVELEPFVFKNNNNEDTDHEERVITVTATGGLEDFKVLSKLEYRTVKNEKNEDEILSVTFDKGIKVQKIDKKRLKIINYGRIFVDDTQYYEITLAHKTNPTVTFKIILKYNQNEGNNS